MDSKEAIFDYPGSFFKSIRVVASDVVKGMEGIRKRDLKCAELRKEVKIERELHLDQIRRHTKLSRFQNKRPNRHADDQVRKEPKRYKESITKQDIVQVSSKGLQDAPTLTEIQSKSKLLELLHSKSVMSASSCLSVISRAVTNIDLVLKAYDLEIRREVPAVTSEPVNMKHLPLMDLKKTGIEAGWDRDLGGEETTCTPRPPANVKRPKAKAVAPSIQKESRGGGLAKKGGVPVKKLGGVKAKGKVRAGGGSGGGKGGVAGGGGKVGGKGGSDKGLGKDRGGGGGKDRGGGGGKDRGGGGGKDRGGGGGKDRGGGGGKDRGGGKVRTGGKEKSAGFDKSGGKVKGGGKEKTGGKEKKGGKDKRGGGAKGGGAGKAGGVGKGGGVAKGGVGSGSKMDSSKAKVGVVGTVRPLTKGPDAAKPSPVPVYCYCRNIFHGQMVGCDNDNCKYEWFHFGCVGLTHNPKGKWYCPDCRVNRSIR